MFLIFDNLDIINLNNAVVIDANQRSNGDVEVLIVTNAITFNIGERILTPDQYSPYCKRFVIENEKWFELLQALKRGQQAFVCS